MSWYIKSGLISLSGAQNFGESHELVKLIDSDSIRDITIWRESLYKTRPVDLCTQRKQELCWSCKRPLPSHIPDGRDVSAASAFRSQNSKRKFCPAYCAGKSARMRGGNPSVKLLELAGYRRF
jgi:hypothetical protein